MRIIGIDPGSVVCGYGVIDKNSSKLTIVEYGVIKAKKINIEHPQRLKEIYTRLLQVINRTNPDYAALETVFFSKNVQSLVKLSHARAAAVLAVVMNDIELAEYSPREVKKSVTGRGAASKEQVQYMVKSMLNVKETPEFFDVTDALAVAICHALRNSLPDKKSNKSWSDYIKNNPDRLIKLQQ